MTKVNNTRFRFSLSAIDAVITEPSLRHSIYIGTLAVLVFSAGLGYQANSVLKAYAAKDENLKVLEREKPKVESLDSNIKKITSKATFSAAPESFKKIQETLKNKTEEFNLACKSKATASLIELIDNHFSPFYVAKIKLDAKEEHWKLVALLFFEKIGHIENFDGQSLVLLIKR